MKMFVPSPGLHAVSLIAGVLLASAAFGAEIRTWTSVEGKTLSGTFEKITGSDVTIKTSDGRSVTFPKSRLSQGDLLYLKDIGADVSAQPAPFGTTPAKQTEKLPIPALEAKIDTKAFAKKKDLFVFTELYFDTIETPHFYVNHKGSSTIPQDVAECAERLWHEMAFYHPGFAAKWGEKRMAVFLTENDSDFASLGKWYRDLLLEANPNNEAIRKAVVEMAVTWPQSSAATIRLDAETADRYKTLPPCPVFKGKDGKLDKGVWVPFRTHFMAEALLDFQAGGVQSFASKGEFAIFTGFAYFKEIQLCGESRTSLLSAKYENGDQTKSTGGFQNSKSWAGELKDILRKGEYVIKSTVRGEKDQKVPLEDLISLERIYNLERDSSTPADIALTYALVAFMHSTFDRVTAFSKLVDTIEKARQIPSFEDMAKSFGYPDVAGFQQAWLEWMKSSQFK